MDGMKLCVIASVPSAAGQGRRDDEKLSLLNQFRPDAFSYSLIQLLLESIKITVMHKIKECGLRRLSD
jgi:hypothetical protein